MPLLETADVYSNFTRITWINAIDSIEEQLEIARKVPPWGIAILVLSGLCMLVVLIILGFACGVLSEQCLARRDYHNRFVASNDIVRELDQDMEIEANEEAPPQTPVGEATPKKKSKQRVAREDDMEL